MGRSLVCVSLCKLSGLLLGISLFFLLAQALQHTVILVRTCLWWQRSWSVNSSGHTEALQEPETLGMMNSAGIERDGGGETEQRVFPPHQ